MNKKEIRAKMKELKKGLSKEIIEKKSRLLCYEVINSDAYKNADCIYSYMPYNQEVDTKCIIEKAFLDGKRVAVPKLYGKEMRFIYIKSFEELSLDRFGIPTPINDAPTADEKNALAMVPGLAFDMNKNRIGYGGGYYDRYFSEHTDIIKLALCYDFQIVDNIVPDTDDIPMDIIFVK